MRILLIIFTLILSTSFSQLDSTPNSKVILSKMVRNCYEIKSLTYQQRKTERIHGKLQQQISNIKYQKDPFKVYLKQKYPKDGLEVLFVNGENNNNALINPNGFPWINVSLNPFGSKMRSGQHHTIFESGFYYFATIVDHLTQKYNNQTDEILKYQGKVKFNNRVCYKIFVDNKNFEYVSHKVLPKESLLTIAKKYFISEYMMLELNPNVYNYGQISPGDIIIRSNDYAKSITLLVDVERFIPLKLIVHDDKGLYEQYEFLDLEINPVIAPEEFNKNYEAYGF